MIQKYPDFWQVVIGNGPIGSFLGYNVICLICAAISLIIEVHNRDVASPATPIRFSGKFLFAHNALRFVGTIGAIFISVRLTYQYVPGVWMLLASVVLGFGSDRLAMWLKKVGVLGTDKLAGKVMDKINQS